MTVQEELYQLIENQVIPDVEDALDEIFQEINDAKNADDATKEEIEELREFKADLEDILQDINNNDIDNEEAKEILDDIKEAITSADD